MCCVVGLGIVMHKPHGAHTDQVMLKRCVTRVLGFDVRVIRSDFMATIMVVDDDVHICQLVNDFFSGLKGHTVYQAHNADGAVAIVKEHKPELALLDIMMPGVHGVEVLRRIKRIHPDIKAIMITAVDDKDIASEAMAEGAADYVTKPLDLNYLDALVTFQVMG